MERVRNISIKPKGKPTMTRMEREFRISTLRVKLEAAQQQADRAAEAAEWARREADRLEDVAVRAAEYEGLIVGELAMLEDDLR